MKPIYLRHETWELFDHKSLLEVFIKWMKPIHYLELGVREGTMFTEVSKYCVRATAVDITPIRFELPNNAEYHFGTTDSFFEQLSYDVKFDFIFIDADHSYEQSLKDFVNAQKYLIEDGLIVLHDTYPINTEYLRPDLCNDSYKTALYIKNNMSDQFEVFTLPFPPGLTFIRKVRRSKQLLWL
jgi:predicted O-methyltransferase YrrM